MRTCPQCGASVPDRERACGGCGLLVDESQGGEPRKPMPSALVWPLGVLTDPAARGRVQAALRVVVSRYWPALIMAAGFAAMYRSVLPLLLQQWTDMGGYYSHGLVVPFIFAFIIWSNRRRVGAVPIHPSWWGLAVAAPASLAYLFGHWTGSSALLHATFLLFIYAAFVAVGGGSLTRVLLFPLLYLAFMIPLPAGILDEATAKIQMQCTSIAAVMLRLSGYGAVQEGSSIESPELPEPLLIGVPCSGFKLLISLLTFTAFFVYMANDERWKTFRELSADPKRRVLLRVLGALMGLLYVGGIGYLVGGKIMAVVGGAAGVLLVDRLEWKKWLLVFISFPLSLFINSLRITMIGYSGILTGSADTMHSFHDYSGILALIVCFVLLFGFARLLGADALGLPDKGERPAVQRKRSGVGAASLAGALLLCVLAVLSFTVRPLALTTKGHLNRASVPKSFGAWISRDRPIEKRVSDTLSAGDLLDRLYWNPENNAEIHLFLSAAKDLSAFHNPNVCIVSGGGNITESRAITFKVKKPMPMTVHASVMETTGEDRQDIVLHWYMLGKETFATTPAMRTRMKQHQVADILRTLTHWSERHKIRRRMEQRQFYWYRFQTEVLYDTDTDLAMLKRFVIDFIANKPDFGR